MCHARKNVPSNHANIYIRQEQEYILIRYKKVKQKSVAGYSSLQATRRIQ